MNLNNMYGECCKCPALMADGRLFTIWEPRQQFHQKLTKKLKTSNDHETRQYLSKQPAPVQVFEYENIVNNICNNQGINQFNVDTSNFHQLFQKKLQEEIEKPQTVDGLIQKDLSQL